MNKMWHKATFIFYLPNRQVVKYADSFSAEG